MAVRLRLTRMGAKKRPFYRVIVSDSRKRRDGYYLENLGTYDPMVEPAAIKLDLDRVDYWLGVGKEMIPAWISATTAAASFAPCRWS